MSPTTSLLLLMLAATAPAACSESNNHMAVPSGSAAGTTGSAGTPASIVVPPVPSCSAAPAPVLAPGSVDPLCAPGANQVSFARDVAPLVGCTGESCHVPWSYSTLVGRTSVACCDMRLLVDPFHPSASHLLQAVTDTDSCVGRMGDLEPPAIATIVAWICQGAPEN
jgi:hypothetical protein